MSGVSQIQEQNEQTLALMREQNELLRERLRAQESSSLELPASGGEPHED